MSAPKVIPWEEMANSRRKQLDLLLKTIEGYQTLLDHDGGILSNAVRADIGLRINQYKLEYLGLRNP